MASPDFYAKNNRKMKCKKCGVERNVPAFDENGLCKECAKASKNCALGRFL